MVKTRDSGGWKSKVLEEEWGQSGRDNNNVWEGIEKKARQYRVWRVEEFREAEARGRGEGEYI